jgi:FlaA1/EpsC-like NDP-sugar epimerase
VTILSNNSFFKPTPLYKEFMILDLIEKNKNITQREMSLAIGIAVSMVNNYLDAYEKNGYIMRKYKSTKSVEYFISKKGLERRKLLNIEYLNSSQIIYTSAKQNIVLFLSQIVKNGFKKILLYGAGEVAEIILEVINSENVFTLSVEAVIDDDQNKQNKILSKKRIVSISEIDNIYHDGILISSYTHHKDITNNLSKINYDKNKIIEFFN